MHLKVPNPQGTVVPCLRNHSVGMYLYVLDEIEHLLVLMGCF